MRKTPERAVVFIDGANLHNQVKSCGVRSAQIDPVLVAQKLIGPRAMVQVRYYGAEIDRNSPERIFRAWQATKAQVLSHRRTIIRPGRIQRLRGRSECAAELRQFLGALPERIPSKVYSRLHAIAKKYESRDVFREKGVDVMIACEMLSLAVDDLYDAGYLVSGDGDFAPAIKMVRALGKKLFVASPDAANELIRVATATIRLDKEWFLDCRIGAGRG